MLTMNAPDPVLPEEKLQQARQLLAALRAEMAKAVIGQQAVVDELLIALLADAHVLIEGVPGLGKTLLVKALARTFGGETRRIQFTPDLMPSDVVGHTLFDAATARFVTRRGAGVHASVACRRDQPGAPPRPSRRCSKRCRRSR
jgi:MoxR-like ATPase